MIQAYDKVTGARRPGSRFASKGQTLISRWQGIDEPETHLWILSGSRTEPLPARRTGLREWTLELTDARGNPWKSAGPVGNFVLRSLKPSAVPALRPKLEAQVDQIMARSACQSFVLFQVHGSPSDFLGVTFWPEAAAFHEYAAWAKNHPWADVIGPLTRAVPLRTLARRSGTGAS